jgi:ATP-binding cassette, subfamily B, bacterial
MKDIFQSMAGLIEDNIFLQDFRDFVFLTSKNELKENILSTDPLQTGLLFENVSFRYPSSQRNALQSVSVEIPKGKTIALVGANGSGKTTFIKLLCGFYRPDKGRILYDGIDISEMKPEDLRKQFTAVFQDFALYNLTAEENILLGDVNKTATYHDMKKAAEDAGIADILETLPDSYHTMLGNLFEKGEGLSIGQWQKIALARAFYRNSPVLLLDEPTSALDAETEAQLLQNLMMLKEQKTVVIISHRFSTVKWADIIYVMDEGKVIEYGSHNELMSAAGKYREMFNAASK